MKLALAIKIWILYFNVTTNIWIMTKCYRMSCQALVCCIKKKRFRKGKEVNFDKACQN